MLQRHGEGLFPIAQYEGVVNREGYGHFSHKIPQERTKRTLIFNLSVFCG